GTAGRGGGRRAAIVGTGLIGGSVGMALRQRGWHVSGVDADPSVAERALELGAVSAVGEDPEAELVVVATPVRAAPEVIRRVLASDGRNPAQVVTDVGGVKAPLAAAIDHPRFVGGHPMAGSEQVGVEGASGDLFVGATWVLTPTPSTDADAYTRLRSVLAGLGANVLALAPDQHDALVAVVSHVPHLTAATLMELAWGVGQEHAALLQLAAGGFRDMTRVAAGQPAIWPDICDENAGAIVETLDALIAALGDMRERVARGDREGLLEVLDRAAAARRALPAGVPRPEGLVEVRVPVVDRPGQLSEVLSVPTALGISVVDVEIAHSVEGGRGVLVLVVDEKAAPELVPALVARGHRASTQPLGSVR
ncbi:MAG TPA: prephenate dehydrogenase/arogenate dehydrogenase family protein, partial [Acidimicrobiales bacterium]|nr:prephenate dehydrogenase/arogenate dehydrogenase family protein [Acidimicrobiales bacterium]